MRKMNNKNVVAIAVVVALAACSGTLPSPAVTVESGEVRGIIEGDVAVFKSIPYAAAPIGDLRWARPGPPVSWAGVLDAFEDGPICMQPVGVGNDAFLEMLLEGAGLSWWKRQSLFVLTSILPSPPMSEDCLTLSVRSPALDAARLPVMVWIHGGAHRFGSGRLGFEGNAITQRKVVLVSINYRLGVFGFLAHRELAAQDANGSTGNYGTWDQIAALRWVRDNISAFGGDPGNVAIFGESAGGHSVGQLMAAPPARGLFHRAIAQSGTGTYQFQHAEHAVEGLSGFEAGERFAASLGASTVAEMRALSAEAIMAVDDDPAVVETWHPQVDGYVLAKTTAETFRAGEQAPVPLMVGSNADEGTVLYGLVAEGGGGPVDGLNGSIETLADWRNMMHTAFGVHAERVAGRYPAPTDADLARQGQRLMADAWFGRHAYFTAAQHANAGHATYLYFFQREPQSDTQTIGATHAVELQYVFGSFFSFWPVDQRDEELARQMTAYWTNFTRGGNPNSVKLPEWPPFELDDPKEMSFGDETRWRTVSRGETYEAMIPQIVARSEAAARARGQ